MGGDGRWWEMMGGWVKKSVGGRPHPRLACGCQRCTWTVRRRIASLHPYRVREVFGCAHADAVRLWSWTAALEVSSVEVVVSCKARV